MNNKDTPIIEEIQSLEVTLQSLGTKSRMFLWPSQVINLL